MSITRNIEFIFTKTTDYFKIPLIFLLEQTHNLKQIILNECITKLNLILFEDNIIIYDINNDILINTVQDLIENKTKICKIIIKPIAY